MRVSQKVKKNMLKNAKGEYETNPAKEGNDVRLTSKDQELVFDGGNDNEEAEETPGSKNESGIDDI